MISDLHYPFDLLPPYYSICSTQLYNVRTLFGRSLSNLYVSSFLIFIKDLNILTYFVIGPKGFPSSRFFFNQEIN